MKTSRLGRTIVLGTMAAALGIWWLARAYEVETSQLLRFLVASVVFVAVAVVLALVGGVALRMLRRRRPTLLGQRGAVRPDENQVKGDR